MKTLISFLSLFCLVFNPTFAKADRLVEKQIQPNNQYRVNIQNIELNDGTESGDNSTNSAGNRGNNNRSDTAREHFSQVAQQVEQILQNGFTGGIGPQVREIARSQNQIQTQLEEKFQKITPNNFFKKLFGYDRKLNREINQLLEQNQARITELQQLLTQTQNNSDKTTLKNLVQTLEGQQTSLKSLTQNEASQSGLLNQIFNLFRQ